MINPAVEEILDKNKNPEINSKFELITMIAKRAQQINDGAQVLTETGDKKPVSIAMWEIYSGKITPFKKEQSKERIDCSPGRLF